MSTTETDSAPWSSAIAFGACTLIWGSTFLFIRVGNDTMPPFWAATLRLALASTIMFALSAATRQPLPRGPALWSAAGYGLFTFGFNLPLLYWGETAVASSVSSILFATVPLTTAMLAWAIGLERWSSARVAGAAIAACGIAIIFSGELSAQGGPVPMLAVLLATLAAVVGTLIYKKGPRQSVIPANAIAALIGCVMCLLLSTIAHESRRPPPTPGSWFALIYLTIAGSVGAFVIWTWLVARWPVSRLSFIAVLSPLIALALGVLVRRERLGPLSLLGAAVVLSGVALGARVGRRPDP